MKSISTFYKGNLFRSRLEARWAVFFDTLGIDYKYEPMEFEEGKYLGYLPDFYLPQYGKYIEIKPHTPDEEEILKAYKLVQQRGKPILIVYGSAPWPGAYNIYPLVPMQRLVANTYKVASLKQNLRTFGYGYASQSLYMSALGKRFSYPLVTTWKVNDKHGANRLTPIMPTDKSSSIIEDYRWGIEAMYLEEDLDKYYCLLGAAYCVAHTATFR